MKKNDIQGMHASMPLSEKMTLIQQYIEQNHFAESGIAYSMLNDGLCDGQIRIWQDSDFQNDDKNYFSGDNIETISSIDWKNNENSTMFSGVYLLSQVLRFEHTKSQDALDECKRAFNSIRAIAELAGPERFGWLCKPYGERCTKFSSPDQNVNAINGLRAYLPYAQKEDLEWIKKFIPAVADYWQKIDYTIDFNDHSWDVKNDPGHMKIFCAVNALAGKLTGLSHYKETAKKILEEYGELDKTSATLYDTFLESYPDYFDDWRDVAEFSGATLLFCSQVIDMLISIYPERKNKYLQAAQRAMEHGLIGFDQDYFAHYYKIQVKRVNKEFFWRPMDNADITNIPFVKAKSKIAAYPNRLMWFDATSRFPMIYLIYLKNGGSRIAHIEGIVREIMEKLNFVRLHWIVDRHNDQTYPEMKNILRALTSEMPNYLVAYWLGESIGFWENGKKP